MNLSLEASAANVRAAIAIEQKATKRAEQAEREIARLQEERNALQRQLVEAERDAQAGARRVDP